VFVLLQFAYTLCVELRSRKRTGQIQSMIVPFTELMVGLRECFKSKCALATQCTPSMKTRPATSSSILVTLFPLACSLRFEKPDYCPWKACPRYLVIVSLHFWQIPYMSTRCPVGLNFAVAETFFVISSIVVSSMSVILPHFRQIRFA